MPESGSSRKYMRYLSLGAEIAVSLIFPILIGYWADEYFQTSPWFIMSGILLGLLLLSVTFYKMYKKLINDSKED